MSPLWHLFSLSFKTALIEPIFKEDELDNFTNYRLISLLSLIPNYLKKLPQIK